MKKKKECNHFCASRGHYFKTAEPMAYHRKTHIEHYPNVWRNIGKPAPTHLIHEKRSMNTNISDLYLLKPLETG